MMDKLKGVEFLSRHHDATDFLVDGRRVRLFDDGITAQGPKGEPDSEFTRRARVFARFFSFRSGFTPEEWGPGCGHGPFNDD